MYTEIYELPPPVQCALDPEDQMIWMDAYNKMGNFADGWDAGWAAVMNNPNVRLMGGIASRNVVDKAGERVIDQSCLATKLSSKMLKPGLSIHEVHSNRPCGVWFSAKMEAPVGMPTQTRVLGAVYKGDPYYDKFWDKVKDKTFKELSIAVYKIDPRVQCDGGICYRVLENYQVFEVSPVPKGACPATTLDTINFSAKGSEDMAEEKKTETDPQSPGDTSNKEALGDLGIEALQRLLMLAADTNKKMDELLAQINKPATDPNEGAQGQNNGQQAPQNGSPQNGPPEKEEKKEEDDKSNKSIVPPVPPTDVTDAEKQQKELANKAEEVRQVEQLQEKAKEAAAEGARTTRPAGAQGVGGAKPKDSLGELLNDPNKLRGMSIQDVNKFVDEYSKGLI